MKKPNHLAIDADLIIYRAAFNIQKDYITVEHKPTGRTKRFDTRTEFWGHHSKRAGGWLAEINKKREEDGLQPFNPDEFEIHDDYELEPVENGYHLIKMYIKSFLKACDATSYTLYIDGGETFRHDAATILQYKGNRTQPKPHYYEEIRNYCIRYHPCVISEGIESDDHLSILGARGEAIQVSCDKDQKQTPSWIYDYDKSDKPFEVKEGVGKIWSDSSGMVRAVGFKSLCWQLCTSDDIDNVKPRALCGAKFGDKKALELLRPLSTKKECLEAVLALYRTWYPEPVTYKHWNTGEEITKNYFEIASEMFTLLYMLRDYDDVTTLASLCDELGVEYD